MITANTKKGHLTGWYPQTKFSKTFKPKINFESFQIWIIFESTNLNFCLFQGCSKEEYEDMLKENKELNDALVALQKAFDELQAK